MPGLCEAPEHAHSPSNELGDSVDGSHEVADAGEEQGSPQDCPVENRGSVPELEVGRMRRLVTDLGSRRNVPHLWEAGPAVRGEVAHKMIKMR